MFSASNMISRAMTYYIPHGHYHKRTKVFVCGVKKKTRYYFGDRENYRREYLRSDHWKELRSRKLTENPLCEVCGSKERVEPHHINYRNLYDVELFDLKTLCRKCHMDVHEKIRQERIAESIKSKKRFYRRQRRLLWKRISNAAVGKWPKPTDF